MIDRQARNDLADALRQLREKGLDGSEFDAAKPRMTKDRAIGYIYDEISTRVAFEIDILPWKSKQRGIDEVTEYDITRSILFLQSDNEFKSPEGVGSLVLGIVLIGAIAACLLTAILLAWENSYPPQISTALDWILRASTMTWVGILAFFHVLGLVLFVIGRWLIPKRFRKPARLDDDYWPFFSQQQFEQAKAEQRVDATP